MRRRLLALAALLASLVVAAPASAGWDENGVMLYGTAHSFGATQIAPDGSGGLIVWWDSYAGGAGRMILARRLTANGDMIPDWDMQNSPGYTIAATPDGLGGLYRVRTYNVSGTQGFDVFALHVRPAGGDDPAWPASGVTVAGTTAWEWTPALAADGTGGVIVAYSSFSPFRIVAKRVLANSTFAPGWPSAGRVIASEFPNGDRMEALSDGAGGAYVGWHGSVPTLARVTSAGVLAPGWESGPTQLSGTPASSSRLGGLIPSADGSVIAFWSVESGSTVGVYLQRVLPTGEFASGWPGGVRVGDAGPDISVPTVVADGAGGAWAAWRQGTTLRGAHVLADGSLASGWPSSGLNLLDANAVLPSWSPYTRISPGSSGRLIACWDDQRRPGRTLARVRWLLADGSADPTQPDSGRVVSEEATFAMVKAAQPDGSGGVYVVWEDLLPVMWSNIYLSWMPYATPLDAPSEPSPSALSLASPWPNPATRELRFRFRLASDEPAHIELLDLGGRRVRSVSVRGDGEQIATFDRLAELPAGVYLARLTQGARARVARVALIH